MAYGDRKSGAAGTALEHGDCQAVGDSPGNVMPALAVTLLGPLSNGRATAAITHFMAERPTVQEVS